MTDAPTYSPHDWYWVVAGSSNQVYSSKAGDYVPLANVGYQSWLALGNRPTSIKTEADLGEVLALYQLRPTPASALDSYQDAHSRKITLEVVAKLLLWLVNEVRTLKGQPTVTAAQFRTFVKGLM